MGKLTDEQKIKQIIHAVAMALVKADGFEFEINRNLPRFVELHGMLEAWPPKQRIKHTITLTYYEVINFEKN